MAAPSDGGKGSDRRPGKIPPGAWEAIFKKPATPPGIPKGSSIDSPADPGADHTTTPHENT